MAKAKQTAKSKRKKIEHLHINLTNNNYMIIGFGIAVIIVGYIFMSANSVDGFLPSVVAPILLVAGYCFIVPFGILFTDKSQNAAVTETNANAAGSVSGSNIKTN